MVFKVKIVYVITGLTVGGAEKVVINLADQFSKKGHQVKIVYLKGVPKLLPVEKNIEVIGLKLNNPFAFFSSLKKFGKILLKFKPDVVHANMFHANIFSRLVRFFYPINFLISSLHNSSEKGSLRPSLYKMTNFLSDINTNVSEEACLAYKDIFKSHKIIPVHNGIDTNNFKFNQNNRIKIRKEYKINDNDFLVLCVGRLNEQKDYPNLIKAINLLPTKNNIKVFIVGEGEEKEKINSIINKHQLSSIIYLLGVRSDIPALMSACDVFILPSACEGFGLVVAESMACERVVIATNSGGVKEVIGNTQFLIPPRDSQALSHAILNVMQMDSYDKELLGKANRKFILNNFSLDSMVQKWDNIYQTQGRGKY